jgi:hypothetical protein
VRYLGIILSENEEYCEISLELGCRRETDHKEFQTELGVLMYFSSIAYQVLCRGTPMVSAFPLALGPEQEGLADGLTWKWLCTVPIQGVFNLPRYLGSCYRYFLIFYWLYGGYWLVRKAMCTPFANPSHVLRRSGPSLDESHLRSILSVRHHCVLTSCYLNA